VIEGNDWCEKEGREIQKKVSGVAFAVRRKIERLRSISEASEHSKPGVVDEVCLSNSFQSHPDRLEHSFVISLSKSFLQHHLKLSKTFYDGLAHYFCVVVILAAFLANH
jgi:hypothetical protein